MLDHLAIHIRYVQSTVGRVCKLHRAKPQVPGSDELKFLFIGRAFGHQRQSVGIKFFAMDQVASHVGDKRIPEKLSRKSITAINRNARRRCEIARRATAAFNETWNLTTNTPGCAKDSPWLFGTNSKHFGGRSVRRNIEKGRRHHVERIAPGVALFVHGESDMRAVIADKFSSGIIEGEAVLAATCFGPQFREL